LFNKADPVTGSVCEAVLTKLNMPQNLLLVNLLVVTVNLLKRGVDTPPTQMVRQSSPYGISAAAGIIPFLKAKVTSSTLLRPSWRIGEFTD